MMVMQPFFVHNYSFLGAGDACSSVRYAHCAVSFCNVTKATQNEQFNSHLRRFESSRDKLQLRKRTSHLCCANLPPYAATFRRLGPLASKPSTGLFRDVRAFSGSRPLADT